MKSAVLRTEEQAFFVVHTQGNISARVAQREQIYGAVLIMLKCKSYAYHLSTHVRGGAVTGMRADDSVRPSTTKALNDASSNIILTIVPQF